MCMCVCVCICLCFVCEPYKLVLRQNGSTQKCYLDVIMRTDNKNGSTKYSLLRHNIPQDQASINNRFRYNLKTTYELPPSASDAFCALVVIRRRDKNVNLCVMACRIDYCNSVFSRVAATHLHRLQSGLTAAARQIVKKRKYDPITTTVRDVLHWLPIQQN